ncbi:YoaK family protein [Asticcacaulis sp. SL142]|uniref:YoaK family protein n=1 Tax=Asticcacaulis sp. SL142 TaxID=2995155 RepID=UPI00226D1651|nr:YoaK family protein [Asticcacaulis sp. SL142]WAC47761.1 YoaK family protein [Asticcacaulis sp. SL142]
MALRFLRQLSGKRRSVRGDRRLGVILAFTAGAINAGGFLAVGVYTSHMSGLVSSFADFLILHSWAAAGLAISYAIAFFFGAVTASLIINWARLKKLHSEFAIALMLEAVLLLVFGALATHADVRLTLPVTIAVLCYIMGLQNGLITKISHAEIRTTHMTGVITDLGIEAGRFLFGQAMHTDARFHPAKTRLLAGLLLGFIIGGIIGAFLFSRLGFGAVWPFAALLTVVAAGPISDDLRRRNKQRPRKKTASVP